jgi:hypothetical protein
MESRGLKGPVMILAHMNTQSARFLHHLISV